MEVPHSKGNPPVMSRYRRPYCPGLAFHVTTRVTGRRPLFDELIRRRIVEAIAISASHSDTEILAYAIMENHLHLIVRQREDPLSRLLQPALRRAALIIQRTQGVEGHVFERRFRARPCLSAQHLRDSIIYTHLNPVRANMCDDPFKADSTSHHVYAGLHRDHDNLSTRLTPALELFATRANADPACWRRDYMAYLAHRQQCDLIDRRGEDRTEPSPETLGGDVYFSANFASTTERGERSIRRMDMRDIALTILQGSFPDIRIADLRGTYLPGRKLQNIRARIIREAAKGGHTGVAIAAFFTMSPSRVSSLSRRK
jgi:REP element-mobilizing transposase RayT